MRRRGVVVVTYASNGIQNGNPDGIALVDAAGTVVEFISYGGTFTAASGPAAGRTSTDIGVTQSGSALGLSLQRGADGTWNPPAPSTFGACNDDGEAEPPAAVATVTVSPATATIFEKGTQGFAATAFDSNGQTIPDVVFTWTSSNAAVATVDATGRATGVSPGEVTITATAPNDVAESATLRVEEAPISTGPHAAKITEIHYDNDGADSGEAIEIEAAAGTDLTGWRLVLYNGTGGGSYNTRALSGFVPATCGGRGVIVISYPANGIQNGAPDGIALVDADGAVVEFLSYEGSFLATSGPATGLSATDIGVSQNSAPPGRSLQRYENDTWSSASSTFGQCNGAAPPVVQTILITGRSVTDPALPVGFQDQLFASLRDGNDVTIPSTFTWTSDTPAIATVDQLGVVTALAEGTAVLRATAADGTTNTRVLPTRVAAASTTAQYVGNAAFGEPTDNDPSDDVILRYEQFTASFNPSRGTPNWVAYELDPSHYGTEDRCDCFTFDPTLPAELTRYTTAEYTGAGAFHGYSIDRGHLARSFDRTAGSLDNARTFYFSNIIPQAADLNQGPWAELENYLGDLARTGGKEVYILTGVAGEKGTIKNQGRIVIPASTWKVAVIMPADEGLANVVDYRDLDVIAVVMPNEAGVRNVDWQTYTTTVDAIEALTGYDLLALLADKTENAIESNTKPPFAIANGPYSASEGSSLTMSAAGSFDANGSITSYTWLFGDGATATGPAVSHTYAQDGTYTVTLTVTDNDGLTDTITTTATVSNAAPSIAPLPAAGTLLQGEAYAGSGTFVDPGADTWTATVDYGDGTGATPLALAGQSFALSHVYQSAGTFRITVSVTDDDETSTASSTVTVLSGTDAIRLALSSMAAFDRNLAQPLDVKLTGAIQSVEAGDINGAVGKLQAAINQLEAFVNARRLSPSQAAAVSTLLARTIQSLTR